MDSIWKTNVTMPSFETMLGDSETDILIIGGGMAGILTAYMLDKRGANYKLIEGDLIASKITKNTTAKITAQHSLIYQKLIKEFSAEAAKKYYEINARAIFEYKKIATDIECDFCETSAFVYSRKSREKIERESRALEKLGIPFEFHDSINLPFSVAGAIEMGKQAEFHPMKFIAGISRGLNIYENTRAIRIDSGTVTTNRGKIKAKKIIVATHFPFINTHGSYFLKMYQDRSYVIALMGAPDIDGMYIDEAEGGFSFRNHKGLMLLGGGSHRTGKDSQGWNELYKFKEKYYPNASVISEWAAQDCMTLDGIPYIGKYSALSKGLYTATGFNKWGMTSSMVSAMILSDLVLGFKNEYADIFSPSRSIIRRQLLCNIKESFVGLASFKTPRCPHLGCALVYNKTERSWDCPCHGSRFEEDGKLIDNPATKDKPDLSNPSL